MWGDVVQCSQPFAGGTDERKEEFVTAVLSMGVLRASVAIMYVFNPEPFMR